jgi:sigma-B regulation protein RsbU (phosphoserine phosphatase)
MIIKLSTTLNGETRTWPVEELPARIGRSSSNLVQVLDSSVSREHAELARDGSRIMIRDLGSRNGTRVNGLDASSPVEVKPGDTIEVGHVMIRAGAEETSTQWASSPGHASSLRLRVADVLQRPTADARDPNRLVRLLAEAGQMLVLPRPMRETCEEILRLVERAVPSNRLIILLRGKDGDGLEQVAARTRGMSAKDPLALSQTIVNIVLGENTAVITADAMNDPRFASAQSVVGNMIHSAMAVPLYDNARVLGILYADSANPTVLYGAEQLELLTLLGNMAAVKISNSRLLEAEAARQRLAHELSTATRIQENLLPEAPTDVPSWQLHALLQTCYEVGGDLYDFYRRADGQLVFLVGDVSGKGMGAALLMSSALSSSRVLYEAFDDPLALVLRLNEVVYRSTDARNFITLFIGYLDPASGRLRYVNCGHPEPLLARGQALRSLEATGVPIGMMSSFPWTMGETTVEPGELVAVFSDGIPEAQRGEEFFDTERIETTLLGLAGEPDLAKVAEGIIASIDDFAAGEHRSDDVTLVLLRRA